MDQLKLLEENISLNIHDLGFGNGFLEMTSKAQATTAIKIDQLDFIKV